MSRPKRATRSSAERSGGAAGAGWFSVGAAVAVARRPDLWATAATTYFRMLPTGWFRRAPFVPVPSRPYAAFRRETMYGSAGRGLAPSEAVAYLEWCRRARAMAR